VGGGGDDIGRIVEAGGGTDAIAIKLCSLDGYLNESGDDKERVHTLSVILVHNALQPFDVFMKWGWHDQLIAESGVAVKGKEASPLRSIVKGRDFVLSRGRVNLGAQFVDNCPHGHLVFLGIVFQLVIEPLADDRNRKAIVIDQVRSRRRQEIFERYDEFLNK